MQTPSIITHTTAGFPPGRGIALPHGHRGALEHLLRLQGGLSGAIDAPAPLRAESAGGHAMGSSIRMYEGPGRTVGRPRLNNAVYGMDVSNWQGNVDWDTAYDNGARFAYIKATEGTGTINSYFAQQYNGSYGVGMIRGAYHFALPNASSGSDQADFFCAHGGGWSADGQTLPGVVDLEYNPYNQNQPGYGLTQLEMVSWILEFSERYYSHTRCYPVIYTSTGWWSQYVGSGGAFGLTNPLWIASWNASVGALPAGWTDYTFWQYADSGGLPGDQDLFSGNYAQLKAFATNGGPLGA